jgi:hypothetical protein
MKNLLFGLLTLGVLLGISAIVVSPELTDLFVNEKHQKTLTQTEGSNNQKLNPETILQKTGTDWMELPYKDRLEFVLGLSKGLESREMEIPDPNELLVEIDTYFENNPKEETVEKAVMTILTKKWTGS